jgi:uncharacterized metal-binding protein
MYVCVLETHKHVGMWKTNEWVKDASAGILAPDLRIEKRQRQRWMTDYVYYVYHELIFKRGG